MLGPLVPDHVFCPPDGPVEGRLGLVGHGCVEGTDVVSVAGIEGEVRSSCDDANVRQVSQGVVQNELLVYDFWIIVKKG